MKKSYTLCTGESKGKKCTLVSLCDRYCQDMDKSKKVHYDPIPYNMETRKCNQYLFETHINGFDDYKD
jgi:hypothetical protein